MAHDIDSVLPNKASKSKYKRKYIDREILT